MLGADFDASIMMRPAAGPDLYRHRQSGAAREEIGHPNQIDVGIILPLHSFLMSALALGRRHRTPLDRRTPHNGLSLVS